MSSKTPLDERLDKDWGDSFREVLGYVCRNGGGRDVRSLLVGRPDRSIGYLVKSVPYAQDQRDESAPMDWRQEQQQKRGLATFEAFLPLIPDEDRAHVIQRAASRIAVLPGMRTLPFLERLIQEGVDLHRPDPENDGVTPFMAYICGQSATLTQAMIDRFGAHPQETDGKGWTALDWAAVNGYTETVRALAKAGWSLHRPGNDGLTPLHRLEKHTTVDARAELLAFAREHHLSHAPALPSRRSRPRA